MYSVVDMAFPIPLLYYLWLQQVHLGKLDVVDLRINQQLDMSEELLGVVSAPADDKLSSWVYHGTCQELC